MQNKAIRKYTEKYSDAPVLDEYSYGNFKTWDQAIIIPLRGEAQMLPEVLESFAAAATHYAEMSPAFRPLIIFNINIRIDDAPQLQENSQNTFATMRQSAVCHNKISENLNLLNFSAFDALVVDHFSTGYQLPADQGVGLARKMAADLAVDLYQNGYIKGNWIIATDGDVIIPKSYFSDWYKQNFDGYVAGVIPFRHLPIERLPQEFIQSRFAYLQTVGSQRDATSLFNQAIVEYDYYLDYYVKGLKYAGSPYAYHCIGSTQVFKIESYCMVRGYPKKLAGEDFYLFNKLRKIGPIIETLNMQPIHIRGRPSNRVPFGTGVGTQKIFDLILSQKPYCLYHPETFSVLKEILGNIEQAIMGQKPFICPQLAKPLLEIIERFGFAKATADAQAKAKTPKAQLQHFHTWFDAFRTLKFIHLMRDEYLGEIPLKETKKLRMF